MGSHYIFYYIQPLWKNKTIIVKKTIAEAKRERFKIGGGPANKDPEQMD